MHINKIELATTDITALATFYHSLLGLHILQVSADSVSFAAGRSVLSFHKSAEPAFYHIAFLLPSNHLREAYAWAAARTTILPFTTSGAIADFVNWNAQAFYFHDPAQNILEFIVHHDLENDAPGAFSAQAICSVCEVGIPVPVVTQACEYLNEKYSIPYFKKGPRLPDFAVMGDEEGLLIITKTGRGWLPTQRPAASHSLQLQVRHYGNLIWITEKELQR